jgi:WhiB family redox-sensing transcriptional regulator
VCRGQPVDLFFPGRGDVELLDAARAVCARCPVRVECLDWALGFGVELSGVWGGLGQSQRVELLRRRAAAEPQPTSVKNQLTSTPGPLSATSPANTWRS